MSNINTNDAMMIAVEAKVGLPTVWKYFSGPTAQLRMQRRTRDAIELAATKLGFLSSPTKATPVVREWRASMPTQVGDVVTPTAPMPASPAMLHVYDPENDEQALADAKAATRAARERAGLDPATGFPPGPASIGTMLGGGK